MKSDPISKLYFDPLEAIEKASDCLFLFSAGLSFFIFFINKLAHPKIFDQLQIIFIITVIISALVGLATRLYFAPRAQSKRFQDFISHAYEINLTHERTVGYYNNKAQDPVSRMAAQLLENVFHSKDTAQQMVIKARIYLIGYSVALFFLVLNRGSNLEVIAIVAQIFFGEQILSKWLRLEWLRYSSERIFIDLYRLVEGKPSKAHLEGSTLEMLERYEVTKAITGITLSKKIFEDRNEEVSKEWTQVRDTLNI